MPERTTDRSSDPAPPLPGVRILLMGPPGAGKGTQGPKLAERFGIKHISTGDLLRAEVEGETEIGRHVRAVMDRGEMVSDELMLDMVMPTLLEAAEAGGYVLDGYPRSRSQAEPARARTEQEGVPVNLAVLLDADDDVLIPRLLERAREQDRADDTPHVIRERLRVYHESIHPLVDFYRERNLLVSIDAAGSTDEVWAQLETALEQLPDHGRR